MQKSQTFSLLECMPITCTAQEMSQCSDNAHGSFAQLLNTQLNFRDEEALNAHL